MSERLTIEWLEFSIANWECLESCGHKVPQMMIPMAKQLVATMQREVRLRKSLESFIRATHKNQLQFTQELEDALINAEYLLSSEYSNE